MPVGQVCWTLCGRCVLSGGVAAFVVGTAGGRQRIDDTLEPQRPRGQLTDLLRLDVPRLANAAAVHCTDVFQPGRQTCTGLAIAEDHRCLALVTGLGDEAAVRRT